MDPKWLNRNELVSWVRLVALLELLPASLDSQLRRDAGLTHFEYYVLAVLSDSPDQQLRMTELAAQTNATLPRLSHVVRRLQERNLIDRTTSERDRRATNVHLTEDGKRTLAQTAPEHVAFVREHVIDALSPQQVDQLGEIADAILSRLDPEGRMTPMYRRHDDSPATDQA